MKLPDVNKENVWRYCIFPVLSGVASFGCLG